MSLHYSGKTRRVLTAKQKRLFGSGPSEPGRKFGRNPGGKRMTKAQKQAKAQKSSVQRRVAVALAKFLKQANPAMKTSGAQVQRLKGGVLKITPIKANAARDVIARAASKVGRAVRGRPFTLGRRRKN